MWYLAKFIYSVFNRANSEFKIFPPPSFPHPFHFNCICIKFKWETMHIFSILGVKVITFLKGKNPHDLS